MAQISIPGGHGSAAITFTITGNAAVNYAGDFNAAVQDAAAITSLSSGSDESTVAGALNIIGASSVASYGLATGHQYTYAAVTNPTRIAGSSAGGDTLLGGGGVSYTAEGANDRVVFDNGSNVYNGDPAGGDTISGGSGSDTINTGTGSNTIFAGSGSTLINLQNTSGTDIAVLLSGDTTVEAHGVNDVVYASAALASTTGTIFGGSGLLTFVAGPSARSLPVTVVGGSGITNMFTNNGSDVTLENSSGTADFIAGAGNETLNGAAAAGGFNFFADTVAADGGSINDSVVGGAGTDYFSTGAGNETIVAGQGGALFHIHDVGEGTQITIADLNTGDYVNFAGLTVAEEVSLLHDASTVTDGNLTVTLPDGTKVEFLGVTSFTGHLI